MPNCGNSTFWLSKAHSEPDGCFSPFSDVNHWASRTFTTNQPSPAGARPEPESASGASGTARVYGRFGPVPPPLLPLPATCKMYCETASIPPRESGGGGKSSPRKIPLVDLRGAWGDSLNLVRG